MHPFTHLHVHTQYSILDGAASVPDLIKTAKADGMTAVAITDHGNMFGVKQFHDVATKEGIKPILGIETYVARRSRHTKETDEDRSGHHLILLAKNKIGYKNLVKLSSYAYTEGFYYRARVDKELLEKYKEGIIACTACLGGEVPQMIMKRSMKDAEEAVLWFKKIYGDDFYLEMQRHKTGNKQKDADVYDNQVKVNAAMLELAKKHQVKVVATNDVHFIRKEDAQAHDRLICLNTGKDLDDPTRMRYTMQEYLKTQSEMNQLFSDVPEALAATQEIVDKIEEYKLNSAPIMPDFPLPEGFDNEDEYLKHLTIIGAKERYVNLTDEIQERIDFELETIKKMGFPGYFLIVQDFIAAAREMGVIVGPGRGSAAGSAVAYCLKITNIDPIAYDLLFERFLNPDRVSMPDIDIDFDDDGRQEVLNWVVKKYGYNRVSHIITFGTMAAKMAIRDIARVHKLPLSEADKLAKLVPETPKITLKKAYLEVPELKEAKNSPDENIATTLRYAEVLEGSVRQTGVHACGIIISKEDLTEYLPVSIAKEAELLVTQYDGRFVESVGMLKMDFLGLKTLSIIKETLDNIKRSKGILIDIDKIPMNDKKTFDLYSNGETTAIFQFESPGMKKHLRALKPNRFEDLVAMNALYRPGPMDYIPSFVARKHGREKIIYDHPLMEDYLNDTYGITVYQEQVMLQARALGGFTRGQSDSLRKAMGKKIESMMNELKEIFRKGCKANPKFMEGCEKMGKEPDPLIDKIWGDWAAFAKYAFNKSHSVCYAYVSYQTAYLKANYPAEFMAAVLSRNLSDIKKITSFMDECRRMGILVLGPDVNESVHKFTVNKAGAIRFGMAAIKGVGENAVDNIIEECNANGRFKDIYDFVTRINHSTVNKRSLEALALAGALDGFKEVKRYQYFIEEGNENFLAKLVRYGSKMQTQQNTGPNLFGGSKQADVQKTTIPTGEAWTIIETLNKEKELIGIYLSAHPLDPYEIIIKNSFMPLAELNELKKYAGKDIITGGLVTAVEHRTTKTGNPFGTITIEDYSDSFKMMLFSKDYINFKQYFTVGYILYIKGKVSPRFNNPDELELKVTTMEMLSDMKEKLLKSIALKVDVGNLDETLITQVYEIAEKHKGNCMLQFLIWDPTSKIWVQMFSRTHKVDISNEFVKQITEEVGLEYKIY